MKEPAEAIVKKGTIFSISGHRAEVSAILKTGVECVLNSQIIMVDFDKIELALERNAQDESN